MNVKGLKQGASPKQRKQKERCLSAQAVVQLLASNVPGAPGGLLCWSARISPKAPPLPCNCSTGASAPRLTETGTSISPSQPQPRSQPSRRDTGSSSAGTLGRWGTAPWLPTHPVCFPVPPFPPHQWMLTSVCCPCRQPESGPCVLLLLPAALQVGKEPVNPAHLMPSISHPHSIERRLLPLPAVTQPERKKQPHG